jgi:ABC-type sulfate/molybdate transport systems ATPase subunit
MLPRFYDVHAGRITIDGVDVRDVRLDSLRRNIGVVFEDSFLFSDTITANIGFGRPDATREEIETAARAAEAHEFILRLPNGYDTVVGEQGLTLSGGQRQRVALARALAKWPRVLLLDEPLSALDARTRTRASRSLAAALRDAGVPALLVTHDFGEAALLGDRVAVIDAGRIVQQGTARDLATSPGSAFVADLTGAVVLMGSAAAGPDGLTRVILDGGGEVASTDPGSGRVAVSVHPWEIALAPPGAAADGSAQNRIDADVTSVTHVGNRVRVGLEAGQPLVAEVTEPAVAASWKAAATRLVPM